MSPANAHQLTEAWGIAVNQVKSLLELLASHIKVWVQVPATPLGIQSLLIHMGRQQRMAEGLSFPATRMEDRDGVLDSWLQPGPDLVTESVWGIEVLSLS